MFSLDDRTGNVITTIAIFSAGAAVLYFARRAFFILLLSLFFAYLLEPAVSLIQRRSPLARGNRAWAIAQVYLIGTLVVSSFGYAFGSRLAAQIKGLNAAVPEILQSLSSGKTGPILGSSHGLSPSLQVWVRDWLASHQDLMAVVFERSVAFVANVAAGATWLLAVPVLAIFILYDGRQVTDALVEGIERRRGQTPYTRILRRVDTVLAQYIRAQFALAGLSFVFYSISMLVLGFPYAIVLGFFGGALEFLPVVGWIASALAMLTIGFLSHAHWIWMACLVIVWRLVQDYVNSPRIMGHNLELRPLTVIIALMVGGEVGGIAGMYLSVPAVAVLRVVWLEFFSTRAPTTAPSGHPIA